MLWVSGLARFPYSILSISPTIVYNRLYRHKAGFKVPIPDPWPPIPFFGATIQAVPALLDIASPPGIQYTHAHRSEIERQQEAPR
jgi:hypothetical protein